MENRPNLRAVKRPRGRGYQRVVLVKWEGRIEPTWEPRSEFENTIALEEFEKQYGTGDNVGEEDRTGMFTGVRLRPRKGG